MAAKVVLWSVGVATLLASLWLSALVMLDRRGVAAFRAQQRSDRLRTKVHIGDGPMAVRLRLGAPTDSGVSNGTEFWEYTERLAPIGFVFFQNGSVASITVANTGWWVPEDGLTFTDDADVNRTLDRFEQALGIPCDTVVTDDAVRYYFRLSPKELAEDSIYRTWNGGDTSVVLRALLVDLTNGKSLRGHGWTLAIGPRSQVGVQVPHSSCLGPPLQPGK